jgi:hypothetical protein
MLAALALASAADAADSGSTVAQPFGPSAPANPFTAPGYGSTMHADSASSGASGWPGPGPGKYTVTANTLGAACPTVLIGTDGMPVALCTKIVGVTPAVYLLDPSTGSTLASLSFASNGSKNVFGGVYTYLDQQNRLVFFDPNGDLVRVAHAVKNGRWSLAVVQTVPAGKVLDGLCASACGGVVGIAPDWRGNVWFATADAVVGFVTPSGQTRTLTLGSGEQVANSISTVPESTAIATDHALYELEDVRGTPTVIWRHAYDRGPSRKPGQLSWGTGSTPVFFGPAGNPRGARVDGAQQGGTRYLTITDNAAPAEHLLIFDTLSTRKIRRTIRVRRGGRVIERKRTVTVHGVAHRPQLVCDIPVLTPGPSGSENAPVASGSSVFVANTYGYPYPASPAGQPEPDPKAAPFAGGVTRVDLAAGGGGCHTVWRDDVRSAAVPRLDMRNGILYTVADSDPLSPDGTGEADGYSEVAIDAANGTVFDSNLLGIGYESNTLQLSATIVPGDVMYQGTISGIDRITRATG